MKQYKEEIVHEPIDLIVLGRKLGTYTGWDELDTASFVFYEFVPGDGIDMDAGDLSVLYDQGLFQYHSDDGDMTKEVDMLEVLRYAPRVMPL